jgi:hypothetical protein
MTDYKPATIRLIKDSVQISETFTQGFRKLIYKNLKAGHYTILVSGKGRPTAVKSNILVERGQLLQLTITMQGQCLYDYPPGYIPTCPENHTDNIIPIVYGLVGLTKEDSNSEDIKFHLGGCIVSDCDPQYYCAIHETEF